MAGHGVAGQSDATWTPPASLEEARARARERFKSRLQAGEKIGECGCGDDAEVAGPADGSTAECVVGVRFRDSGRVYYFRPDDDDLSVGDWVVVPTGRGQEAARVVIAPHQVRGALLRGVLGTVIRRLDSDDIERMESQRRHGAAAVRWFGERARARQLGIKPITADYAFDGSAVTLNYSVPDRERAPDAAAMRDFAHELAEEFGCRVELKQIGPRDEARLLGGLGRCGRTLCCSSWLPVFPEISMSMAKNQELPLNPAKVSGVCGRLLCCLSYENDQYRQMKAVMPKLGQSIETPGGTGRVISMHLLKEIVTVRLDDDNAEATFRCDELDLGTQQAPSIAARAEADRDHAAVEATAPLDAAANAPESGSGSSGRRRRRRRAGRRGGSSAKESAVNGERAQ